MKKFFVYLCIFLLSLSCAATEMFLSGTQDVPLMAGLVVNQTTDMDFDTPAGQILVLNAVGKTLTGKEIQSYYRQTLPAMGWHQDQENKFIRERDSIIITVIREKKPAIVRFEIAMMNGLE